MSELAISGLVATTPRFIITQDGLPICSFRLAAPSDPANIETSGVDWLTITAFRQLARNVSASIAKGDRVSVVGRLRIRDWDNGERSGTSVEIEATSLGHDLNFGESTFLRNTIAPNRTYEKENA